MTNYAQRITIPLNNSQPGKLFITIGVANQTNGTYGYEAKRQVLIDSGSCGIVIPCTMLLQNNNVSSSPMSATTNTADGLTTGETTNQSTQMPLIPGVTTKYESATIKYQPSGDTITGFYYYIDELGIGDDSNGNPRVIAKNVKVIGASNSDSVSMMGVGFDRPLTADNAFLANLTTADNNATPLYPSYYLDHQTVELGLNPSGAFAFQTLNIQTKGSPGTYQDWSWSTPQGTIAAKSGATTLLSTTPASLLIDTGLDLMMVNNMGTLFPSPGTNPSWNTAEITLVINVDSGASPAYTFALTGTAQASIAPIVYTTTNSVVTNEVALQDSASVNTPAPTLVHVLDHAADNAFINTGFNPLFSYGMIFDPTNNRVGFIPLGGNGS